MNDPGPSASLRCAASRGVVFLVVTLLLTGIVWAVWSSLRAKRESHSKSTVSSRRSRDVYADSPYLNARPGVEYVGDETCATCHKEVADAYRSHPMGRSLAPIGGRDRASQAGTARAPSFEAQGLNYTVEHRDGRVFHKATRRGVEGDVLAGIEAEVGFSLGSGTRGKNYLIERDGFLFLSPIAWFALEDRWGISPGFEERVQQTNFERAVYPDCLFCHTNRVSPMVGPMNRYETPVFRGHAIGCERCHGPGSLHVDRGGTSSESDLTIVNPAKLVPALRDSVCQQCHLQGSVRTTRAGREEFDFRPGLPMHRFFAVFHMKQRNREQSEAIGHVEQIESSRCFRESFGRLGCISCHDPHQLPEPSKKTAYYRERCMTCHDKKGCSLPLVDRAARGKGDDCIACHMGSMKITNIPHTAATDHRISREGPGSGRERPRSEPGRPGEIPLVDHHWELMTEEEREDAKRDLGVASLVVAQRLSASPQLAKLAATQALPLLDAAARDRPDDLIAGNSLGIALEIVGRGEDALHAFEAVLRVEPDHEKSLRHAARLHAILQRPDLARETSKRTIAVNPWRSDYRLALARFCAQAGDWAGAIAACHEAIKLNPDWLDARSFLVECYVRADEREKADSEFQKLLRFYPASRDVWQLWYERLEQPRRTDIDPTSN